VSIALFMILGGGAAGLFGSLLGLGGGILIVPLLTLGFGLPVREAVGVSLVSVIVTSGASAGIYLQRHVANLRLGMTLELFTASGALIGGLIAFLVSERVLAGLFTALLVYVAASMWRAKGASTPETAAAASTVPSGRPSFAASLAGPDYSVSHVGWGAVGSVGAGVISALLGVGGGLVKVPVMHLLMGVPMRVATATSNLMIGITASASAIIYLLHGEIDPYVAGITAVGVFAGASLGSRVAARIDLRLLRLLFVVVLLYTAVQMARRAVAL
jgi:uncharacterized membrane protein YfcA